MRGGWTGWIARRGLVAAGRRFAREARPRPDALRRMRVDPDWRRIEEGRAARLGPDRTIAVTRRHRWRRHDPLRVEVGWWALWRTVGLGLWAGAVGGAWWLGRSRGRGPLATLREPDTRPGG